MKAIKIKNSFKKNQTLFISIVITLIFTFQMTYGQKSKKILLSDWKPKSQMIVSESQVIKPKFPVIDIHNHLGNLKDNDKYIEEMDKAGVWMCVSLDGHSKDFFYREHIKESARISKERILVFFAPEWSRIDEVNFGENEAKRLEEAFNLGAKGLKVFKSLGLTIKDKSSKVVPVDNTDSIANTPTISVPSSTQTSRCTKAGVSATGSIC